LKISQYAMKL